MEFTEAFVEDPYMHDEWELLPGNWTISYAEIKNFKDGKPFYIDIGYGEYVTIENTEEEQSIFSHYYDYWENFHYFGFPGNWQYSPGWFTDILKFFQRIYNEVEMFNMRKNRP